MHRPTAQDALTEEELDNLLAHIDTRYPSGKRNLALLLVMADAGLRVSEALDLTMADLVREAKRITHVNIRNGKGGKQGRVALTARAAMRLENWLDARFLQGIQTPSVFCTVSEGRAAGHFSRKTHLRPGGSLHRSYVWQMVVDLSNEAGIERRVSPHTLRHTFGTRLLRATGNLEVVRKALRHSSIQSTQIYSHLNQQDVDKGIAQLSGG